MPARRKSNQLLGLSAMTREDRKPKRDFSRRLTRAPSPPAELSQRASEEWRRLAPACVAIGTLTGADLTAFALLCETLASEREARETVAAEGLTTPTAGGGKKPHPAVRIAENARNQSVRLLEAFGLTPRGRQSVDISPRDSPANELAEKFWSSRS